MCSSSTRSASLSTTSLGLRPAITPTIRRHRHHPFKRDGIYGGEHLAERGLSELPAGLTLHSMRRTFASVLFALGRSAPEVMEQLGHADPRLTLRVYARSMRRDAGERDRLTALVGGADWALLGTGASESHSRPVLSPPEHRPKPADLQVLRPMEPAGIEPATSCLQSRRSPI